MDSIDNVNKHIETIQKELPRLVFEAYCRGVADGTDNAIEDEFTGSELWDMSQPKKWLEEAGFVYVSEIKEEFEKFEGEAK